MDLELARQLQRPAESKILLLVADGLGGLPHPDSGRSELETAQTPHLDGLAARSALGLTVPVGSGITPGSGPGHLALFGYDPFRFQVGRGALEALGSDFALGPDDVAARGNFCTLDATGRISDRRAGRIATERSRRIVERLRAVEAGIAGQGVELFVEPVREHRFVLVLRGEGLSDAVTETDPQRTDVPPLRCEPMAPGGERTADVVNRFVGAAAEVLASEEQANGILLRGFARRPSLPAMADVWGLRPASCALYPMYRGLATLAGMTALAAGATFQDQIASVREHWDRFDFFFMHYKDTDAAGEDGDFPAKVSRIEELDAQIPALLDLDPDVLMVSGDHSTPAAMGAHSWHPVPFLLSARWVRYQPDARFDEGHCAQGALGTFPATEALPLAMAHAGRLAKYGA